MARRLRLEAENGVYHVINRGNYRAPVFRSDQTKAAFLRCLDETCVRTDWRVHAWCIMSNHYHLAVATPESNLVEGMRWLQGTFATRFNRLRHERGHLFQGRYKSLMVDPAEGLGPLCHYIHLNPVRARLCGVADLPAHRWTNLGWLMRPKQRPEWSSPDPALVHAGGLADNASGRGKYLEYLAWLSEDEPARKQQKFEAMSRGWIIGSKGFARALVQEHKELSGQGPRLAKEVQAAREAVWLDTRERLLRQLCHTAAELEPAGKSVDWKLAVAAGLKARTTATNRWLAQNLCMGNMHEVSRKVAAWIRRPDPALFSLINQTPNPKPQTLTPAMGTMERRESCSVHHFVI
jgi:REP element-mobilizing transposase RayT